MIEKGKMVKIMFWVVTYDVPATHDEWRVKIAAMLSKFGLFRIQYSVFMGDRTQNVIQACMLSLKTMLKGNTVPADIRFFPLCATCEQGVLRLNNCNYKPGNNVTSAPASILVTNP